MSEDAIWGFILLQFSIVDSCLILLIEIVDLLRVDSPVKRDCVVDCGSGGSLNFREERLDVLHIATLLLLVRFALFKLLFLCFECLDILG